MSELLRQRHTWSSEHCQPCCCCYCFFFFYCSHFLHQVPRMVEGLMSHHCSQVAAAKDHTVVLTEEGYVYTFGLNTFHQLGLSPPPAAAHVPKQVGGGEWQSSLSAVIFFLLNENVLFFIHFSLVRNTLKSCLSVMLRISVILKFHILLMLCMQVFSKTLKGRTVIGVAAGRFHTVLWTREAVYTTGLNGGQLGKLRCASSEQTLSVNILVKNKYCNFTAIHGMFTLDPLGRKSRRKLSWSWLNAFDVSNAYIGSSTKVLSFLIFKLCSTRANERMITLCRMLSCLLWSPGYLLDPNGEKCVTAPRQVSALYHKDVTIAMVAASDGATVVVTEKGDVYLLADYQCKKIASRWI